MAKKTSKKAARRRAAKRDRLIRRYGVYGVLLAVCLVCVALIPVMNRPLDRAAEWTPAQGAIALDEAPVPETPAPTPEPTPIPEDTGMTAAEALSLDADAGAEAVDYEDPEFADFGDGDEPVDEEVPEGPVTLTITAAGDCTLGGCLKHDTYKVFRKYVDENGLDYFLKNVKGVFEADDLTIVNLEGPLTDVGTMTTKSGICFRGEPEWTAILTGASVELCNYANNHNMDMGQEGFDRTLQALDDAQLGYCVYDKVYHTTVKGVRITALGFDKWTNKQDEVVAAVQRERADCDLLIVNCHWGREMHYEAMKDQKAMGHAIIDAGADLVIGTHPHVFGGVELYNGKYIAYSLGNFCFGGNTVPSDQRTMIFQQQFTFENGQLTDGGINIIPCLVSGDPKRNDFQPYILEAKEGTALLKKIARYSINMGDARWMPGSYPEQIGLIPATAPAVQTAQTAAAAASQDVVPTFIPAVSQDAAAAPQDVTPTFIPAVSQDTAAAAPEAVPTFIPAATAKLTEADIIPADQVFTEEDGFDVETFPQTVPAATEELLNGLGQRPLTAAETSALQEQIYNDQMTKDWQ